MITIGLVVLVIFLFLRTPAGTVIPSVAVPSLAGGNLRRVMYLLGYSLNNLTLMALTISTGFVVDDAIVMIENIARYIPRRASARLRRRSIAPNQIGFTILSLTVSLIRRCSSRYVLFMGDIVGAAVFTRVRGHAQRHHFDLRHGVVDAHAHDVRASASPQT